MKNILNHFARNTSEALSNLSKNQKLIKDSIFLLSANVIVTLLGLIRTPIMTWTIPKDQIGMLAVLTAWLPIVQLLSLPGLDSASYHYIAKGQVWAYIINISHRLRWSLLSSLALFLGAVYWIWREESALAWLFIVAALSFPLSSGLTVSANLLNAQERFKSVFFYRIGESLVDFAGFIPILISLIWINKIITFYTVNQVATSIMQIGLSFLLYHELKTKNIFTISSNDSHELVSYGKHLTALSGTSVVQAKMDSFLVGMVMPLDVTADYSIATIVGEQLKRVWGIYISLRYPTLVRMPKLDRQRRFIYEGVWIFLFFIILGILLAMAATFLIPILLPNLYNQSIGFAYILIAANVIGMPGGMSEQYFRTEQNHTSQYQMRVLGMLIGVLAPTFFVLQWGAYGAAIGRFIANFSFSIVGCSLFYNDYKILKKT